MTGPEALQLLYAQLRPHLPALGQYLMANLEEHPKHGFVWAGDQLALCLYLTRLMAPADVLLGLQIVSAIRRVSLDSALYEEFVTTIVQDAVLSSPAFYNLERAPVRGSC